MKLFMTKRQFQGELNKVVSPLQTEIEDLNRVINNKEFEYLSKCSQLEKKNEKYKEEISKLEKMILTLQDEIDKLELEKRRINGAKGGLTKQLNKVESELNEANEKLSQRYILKELVAEKSKNMQTMKTKSGLKTSNIIKKVKED